MDGTGFDTLTRTLSGLRSRRGLAQVLLGVALGGTQTLLDLDATTARGRKRRKHRDQRRERTRDSRDAANLHADKKKGKKKPCPPCKKRKQGKCKGTLPDGSACPGGSCRAGSCISTTSPPDCEPSCTGKACGDDGCGTSCGTCTGGLTCQSGQCVLTCDSGLTPCAGACVDLQADSTNCGACGTTCSFPHASATCHDGVCTLGACYAGFANCDSDPGTGCETDVRDDPANCGTCGTVCGQNLVCVNGACAASCGMQTPCNGLCRDLQNDPANCGACGNACAMGLACAAGTCKVVCGGGGSYCTNVCVNLQSDWQNCGSCGNVCPMGALSCIAGKCTCPGVMGLACSGVCVDAASNVNNCGACANKCATGASCTNGACACPAATPTVCNGACTNTVSSKTNCGGCGTMCMGKQACVNSSCGRWASIATGAYASHNCAVTETGNVACWGYNNYGQLGDGTIINRSVPTSILGLGNVKQVAISIGSTCALKNDGTVWCWGYNTYGQLGDNTTTNRLAPVQVQNLTNVAEIATAYYHVCARKNDGTVWCWGYNTYGELGDNTLVNRSTPVQALTSGGAAPVTTATGLTVGNYHSCVTLADTSMRCWGYNTYGAIGDGTAVNRSTAVPVLVAAGGAVLMGFSNAISAGYQTTCGVMLDGTVRCWGYDYYGNTGYGDYITQRNSPIQPGQFTNMPITGVADIKCSYYDTCARMLDGTMRCWGYNNFGELGDGSTTERDGPVQVLSGPGVNFTNVIAVGLGYKQTCAITGDYSLWCWGYNTYGQVGDNTTTNRSYPTAVIY